MKSVTAERATRAAEGATADPPLEVRRLETALFDRERRLREALHRVADLEAGAAALAQRLHSIENSKSWKLTRPLRALFEGLRRLRRRRLPRTTGTRDEVPELDYSDWVDAYDTLTPTGRQEISKRILTMTHRPLYTVVLPALGIDEARVDASVRSVKAQLYPRWELLVMAGAAGRQPDEPRIRRLASSYGPERRARALNEAAEQARGDYLVFLEPGDALDERALFAAAEALDLDPEISLLYADEDEYDEKGARRAPLFKPDWSPDLFYSHDFLTGLVCYRTSLFRRHGGFDEASEEGSGFDLRLRMVEELAARQIWHLPSLLYHRRPGAAGANGALATTQRRREAEIAALRAHFQRAGVQVDVDHDPPRRSRCLRYVISGAPPLVSVVVPTKDRVDLLSCCVDGILKATDYPSLELLVVDNQSQEPETFDYFEQIERDSRVRILRYPHPYNFSAINNLAVAEANGELVALINSDIEFTAPDWLRLMAGYALRPEIGAVGPLLLYPSGDVQSAGIVLGAGGVAGNRLRGRHLTDSFYDDRPLATRDASAVTAAFLLLRRAAYEEVGGLDEKLIFAFNDVDFCLRLLECGYRNLWTSQVVAIHHESQVLKRHDSGPRATQFAREVAIMHERWGHVIAADPCYNRQLSLALDRDYQLANPPRHAVPPHRSRH